MPIYSFQCQHCSHEYDDLMGMHEVENPKCPKCFGDTKRMIGLPSSWNPHPIVFQNSASRQADISRAANLMVMNGDDRK